MTDYERWQELCRLVLEPGSEPHPQTVQELLDQYPGRDV